MILTTSGHLLTVYNIWCSCQDLCCLEKEFLKFLEKVSECMSVARLFYHNNARRTKENLVLHFILQKNFPVSKIQWNSEIVEKVSFLLYSLVFVLVIEHQGHHKRLHLLSSEKALLHCCPAGKMAFSHHKSSK